MIEESKDIVLIYCPWTEEYTVRELYYCFNEIVDANDIYITKEANKACEKLKEVSNKYWNRDSNTK